MPRQISEEIAQKMLIPGANATAAAITGAIAIGVALVLCTHPVFHLFIAVTLSIQVCQMLCRKAKEVTYEEHET